MAESPEARAAIQEDLNRLEKSADRNSTNGKSKGSDSCVLIPDGGSKEEAARLLSGVPSDRKKGDRN